MKWSISIEQEINYSWWLLRLLFIVTFIIAGADKFIGFFTNWQQFIHYTTLEQVKLPVATVLMLVGIAEIGLGLLLCTRWVKTAALLIMIWMIGNGLYLASVGMYFDTAARYCSLGICALVLFHLTRIRDKTLKNSAH